MLTRSRIVIAIGLIICWISSAVEAQSNAQNQGTWKPPMTPWREPDLRGTWPLNHLINTSFQRPERFGERRSMTDEEFAAAQESADDRNTRFQSGAIPTASMTGAATRLAGTARIIA